MMKPPLHVLLVDGHLGVREGLSKRLRRDLRVGTVAVTSNLATALRYAQERAPDVVLGDPKTLDGDAAEVVRQLSSAGHPVVVLTSSLIDDERAGLYRAGAAAVLLKGCSVPVLLATMEAASARQSGQSHPPLEMHAASTPSPAC